MVVQAATASASASKTCACASTMSAPDAAGPASGLGQPSRGSTNRISVSPKLSMARAALPIFSPNCGRTRTMTGVSVCAILRRFLHGAGELLEIARFAEIAIDRCEADIGDTVDQNGRASGRERGWQYGEI